MSALNENAELLYPHYRDTKRFIKQPLVLFVRCFDEGVIHYATQQRGRYQHANPHPRSTLSRGTSYHCQLPARWTSRTCFVETGPGSTLKNLLARLADYGYGPTDIDHVLVTHIHLDHAGAAGWWAQQGAQVYVHHVGAKHLIYPTKLLASAQRIYGDQLDSLWGETLPAPETQVTALYDGDQVEVGGLSITALDTPGHASHHHVYQLEDIAFTGDAAGIQIPGPYFVDLPAPPPEFNLELWQHTIERLLSLPLTPFIPPISAG